MIQENNLHFTILFFGLNNFYQNIFLITLILREIFHHFQLNGTSSVYSYFLKIFTSTEQNRVSKLHFLNQKNTNLRKCHNSFRYRDEQYIQKRIRPTNLQKYEFKLIVQLFSFKDCNKYSSTWCSYFMYTRVRIIHISIETLRLSINKTHETRSIFCNVFSIYFHNTNKIDQLNHFG